MWCATRPSKPPSATPGVDYIPSSKKIEFKPGKTEEVCIQSFGKSLEHFDRVLVAFIFYITLFELSLMNDILRYLILVHFPQTCSLSIMDDIQNPAIEGSESFVVFLSSAQGAVLTEPFEASVIIEDTVQDSK